MKPSIAAAAIRVGERIFTGDTHVDAIAKLVRTPHLPAEEKIQMILSGEAGFITDDGDFVDREEARTISQQAGVVEALLEDGWIGVDLDGTLAHHTKWKGATKIGKPIPAMVRRVRRWVGHGKKVKIFTARADDEKSVNAIKKWLKDNDLPDLEVTNLKDKDCLEIWDDRAVAVEKNTGRAK